MDGSFAPMQISDALMTQDVTLTQAPLPLAAAFL
jgi:hypothetical protein